MKIIDYAVTLFILLFNLVGISAKSQSIKLEWVKSLGAINEQTSGLSILVDSNKAIVTGGLFRSTVDFDTGPGSATVSANGNNDIFIAKYDTASTFKWVKRIGGSLTEDLKGMKFDRNGNLIILGSFQGTVDMDPGPGVFNLIANFTNSFLLKLDNNGNFIWAKHFSFSGMTALDIDAANNPLMGGRFLGRYDFDPGTGIYNAASTTDAQPDMFILKLSENGNFIWMKQINNHGGEPNEQFALESDKENNIYFGGYFSSIFDFDPGTAVYTLTSSGSADAFVMKLNQEGQFQWALSWGSSGNDKIYSMEVDDSGNLYSTGQFQGNVDFDPGTGSFFLTSPPSIRYCFISKLDKNGALQFARQISGESYGQSIKLDSVRNIYVAGSYQSDTDFDPGAGIYQLRNGHLFTMKLYPDGNFAWAAGYVTQPPSVQYESPYSSIAIDIFSNVYFTGSFPYQVDFDPNSSSFVLQPQGSWDAYIHKLSQCHSFKKIEETFCSTFTLNSTTYTNSGVYYQVLSGIDNCDSIVQLNLTQKAGNLCGECSLSGIKIYPIPFKNNLVVNKNQTACLVYLTIYNSLGQLVLKDRLIRTGLNDVFMPHLAAGVYYYIFHSNGKSLLSGKTVKL